MRSLFPGEPTPGIAVPTWGAFVIVGLGLAVVLYLLIKRHLEGKALDATFRTPVAFVVLKTTVRCVGELVDLERFAMCWNMAFECIAEHGPWKRGDIVARLGPGPNRVEVQATDRWDDGRGHLVGGQYAGGVLLVGPSLDVMCHELMHRCEEVLDPSHEPDSMHTSWQGRGLSKADVAYRTWLAKQPA